MVIGIIVSYNPKFDELLSNSKNLLEEVDKLILVDNGSNPTLQRELTNKLKSPKIEILNQKENLGLAKAQNIGIQRAFQLGANYVLFLDDDSEIKKGSVKLLLEELEKNPKLGIAACHIIHKDSNKIQKYWVYKKFFYKRLKFTNNVEKLEFVNTVISSGSLIPKVVIEKCGWMRENFFIDYVDIEFCLRIRANGYSITVLKSAELIHHLGNTSKLKIGHLSFFPTNHSPLRRYYMIRNRIWTWKIYAFSFPAWFLLDLGNFFIDNLRVFIFEEEKWEKSKYFIKGLVDGFLKK